MSRTLKIFRLNPAIFSAASILAPALLFASSAFGQASKPRPTPAPYNERAKPDLTVATLRTENDAGGAWVKRVAVNVTNGCRESSAAASYVLITFRENAQSDAKAIYYIGSAVRALKGGESDTQIFDVSDKKIPAGSHVFAEADPYKKVAEASEDNNWRTLYPNHAGAVLTQPQCAK